MRARVGWIRLGVIVLAIGALEFACRFGFIDHRVLIAPSAMADALVRLLVSGQVNAPDGAHIRRRSRLPC